MVTLALAAAGCAALNLGGLEPQAQSFTFRQGATHQGAAGAYFVQVVERATPGEAQVRTGVSVSAEPQRLSASAPVKYGFLSAPPHQAADGWSRRTDYSALPDDLRLAPGETVSFDIPQDLRAGQRTHRVTGEFRLTHEGCATFSFGEREIPVHRIQFENTTHVLAAGEPAEISAATQFQVSPDLGWWVSSQSPGAPGLVLTDIE